MIANLESYTLSENYVTIVRHSRSNLIIWGLVSLCLLVPNITTIWLIGTTLREANIDGIVLTLVIFVLLPCLSIFGFYFYSFIRDLRQPDTYIKYNKEGIIINTWQYEHKLPWKALDSVEVQNYGSINRWRLQNRVSKLVINGYIVLHSVENTSDAQTLLVYLKNKAKNNQTDASH